VSILIKFLIFLLFFFNILAEEYNFQENKDYILLDNYIKMVKKRKKYLDVTDEITHFKKGMEAFASNEGLHLNEAYGLFFSNGEKGLEELREDGVRNELIKLYRVLVHDSQYGDTKEIQDRIDKLIKGNYPSDPNILGNLLGRINSIFTNDEDFIKKLKKNISSINKKNIDKNINNEKKKCGVDRDISGEMPPIRNQGGFGWCHSHVAADLFGHKIGKHLSATSIAFNYFNGGAGESYNDLSDYRERAADRLFILWPLKYYIRQNFEETKAEITENTDSGALGLDMILERNKEALNLCLESEFPSNDIDNALVDTLDLLEEIQESKDKFKVTSMKCFYVNTLLGIFPSALPDQILTALEFDLLNDGLGFMMYARCQLDSKLIKDISLESIPYVKGREEEVFQKINDIVDSNRPVGLSINSEIMDIDQFADKDSSGPSGHMVSIVGKKWNEKRKRCEYLIRNSWGEDYDGSDAGREADSSHPGHVWLSKSALARNLKKVIYVK
jgi:hypothetical protein